MRRKMAIRRRDRRTLQGNWI